MKKLVLGLSLVLTVSTANALSNNATFVAVDNSVETNICLVAAKEGYQAARNAGKTMSAKYANASFNITCNGLPVKKFAKEFNQSNTVVTATPTKSVMFVAADKSKESVICASAVNDGLRKVARKNSLNVNGIVCNGQKIQDFVKKNQSS